MTDAIAKAMYDVDWPPAPGKESGWSEHHKKGTPDAAARRYIAMAEVAVAAQAARIEALEGLIYRNCDPGGMTESDAEICEEIIARAVLQEK